MLTFFDTSQSVQTPRLDGAVNLDLRWVKIMSGMNLLRGHAVVKNSAGPGLWDAVFHESETLGNVLYESTYPALAVPDWMNQLISIFDTAQLENLPEDNPYKHPLQQLLVLATTEILPERVGAFTAFIAKLPAPFLMLLERFDDRALLILGYWCAMFSKVDQWWITESARRQHVSICTYLSVSSDSRIRRLVNM